MPASLSFPRASDLAPDGASGVDADLDVDADRLPGSARALGAAMAVAGTVIMVAGVLTSGILPYR